MKSVRQSSPRLPKGCFRKPGTVHIHVDSRDIKLIDAIHESVRKRGIGSKKTTVLESARGSQFKNDAHNPGGDGNERFVSIAVNDRGSAVVTLKYLLGELEKADGAVVEAEHVLGYMSSTNPDYSNVNAMLEGDIFPDEVRFEIAHSLPIETHHCFEIYKNHETQPPFSADELCSALGSEGLEVKTWSLFDRKDVWSFRSTVSDYIVGFANRYRRDFDLVNRFLKTRNVHLKELWVVVEEVLGLWKTPLTPCTEASYRNRASVKTLIGSEDSVNFETILDECSKDDSSDAAETEPEKLRDITRSLEPFRRVVEEQQLDPVLLELSIVNKLPFKVSNAADGNFAAHMACYSDTRRFHVLHAWQKAIKDIVQKDVLQIDPIVSHEQTYGCAFLFDDLEPSVERACYKSFGIPPSQQAKELLARSIDGQDYVPITSGCREIYNYNREETPAPVDNTVRSLAQGFVFKLMDLVDTGDLSASERAGIIRVLYKLSHLLIVPFRWPSKGAATSVSRSPLGTGGEPGGCLFVVVAPGPNIKEISEERLENTAVRLSWVLLQAALDLACSNDATQIDDKIDPFVRDEIQSSVRILRPPLNAAKLLPISRRFDHVLEKVSFLEGADVDTLEVLRKGLSIRNFKVDEVLFDVLQQHYPRASSKSTVGRHKQRTKQKKGKEHRNGR